MALSTEARTALVRQHEPGRESKRHERGHHLRFGNAEGSTRAERSRLFRSVPRQVRCRSSLLYEGSCDGSTASTASRAERKPTVNLLNGTKTTTTRSTLPRRPPTSELAPSISLARPASTSNKWPATSSPPSLPPMPSSAVSSFYKLCDFSKENGRRRERSGWRGCRIERFRRRNLRNRNRDALSVELRISVCPSMSPKSRLQRSWNDAPSSWAIRRMGSRSQRERGSSSIPTLTTMRRGHWLSWVCRREVC